MESMGSDIALSETLGAPHVPGLAVRILPAGKPHLSQKACASSGAVSCDYELMSRVQCLLTPLLTGLLVTLLQLAMAVGLLAPQEPILERYSALVQHDSYWFMNIIDRGYQTIVPPVDHKVMELSNVAFFPAYPAIAALFRYAFNVDSFAALLITAQLATWFFWTYFFLFCKRWNVSPALQICGTLLIVAHPAAFFLVAGYSESLFLMTLFGFIYWSTAKSRSAKIWAALHGFLMSAARIVGIVCALFPVVYAVLQTGWRGLREPRKWLREHTAAVGITVIAICGAIGFFIYSQLRWGHWDIYMLTQAAGWGIVPDYLAVFKPGSYRWLVPALNDPTEASQLSMTLGGLLLVGIALCELVPAIRRRAGLPLRAGIYFCAAAIYYLSVSGVACVNMESMLRYEFCVHALIVLAFLNFLNQFRTPPMLVRAFGIAAVAFFTATGLCVQGWYVWNFTRGNWVA
ncbi:MAG: hypothetical protein DMC60_06645 [Verrucomicrobia bacterium]|nr:MAG: hypothetical protein DMC60_06645 [Verrucomicrobiota bacterium]